MDENNNINQLIEILSQNKLEEFKNEINNYQNNLINQINKKFEQFDKTFNKHIEMYNEQIKNKMINNDDILRKKQINLKEIKIPPLICLKKLDNTNYLINLLLQYLSNIYSLVIYFFNQNKENKILQNSKNDPTGNYLCPTFLKLLDNLWKGTNKIYDPKEIHKTLKNLKKIDYNSPNPGKILKDIIIILHRELISDKDKQFLEKPRGNNDKKVASDQFDTYNEFYKSKISIQFFSTIKKVIKNQDMPKFYLYDTIPIIEIYLDKGKGHNLSLENDFKDLFKNYNEQIEKISITKLPFQLVININRGNNQKKLSYPKILECECLLDNKVKGNFDLYGVIMKNNNNNYYAYLKNCINSKWYLYKDEVIQIIYDENNVINEREALLLAYQFREEK